MCLQHQSTLYMISVVFPLDVSGEQCTFGCIRTYNSSILSETVATSTEKDGRAYFQCQESYRNLRHAFGQSTLIHEELYVSRKWSHQRHLTERLVFNHPCLFGF